MFIPSHFKQTDPRRLYELMRDYPFALLSVATDNEIEAGHVPVHTTMDEAGNFSIRFHLANSNPLTKLIDGTRSALIVFTGPHTYISPDWYGTENQVPTWNYAVVQARGKPAALADEELMRLLDDLSADAEENLAPKKVWTIEKVDDRLYQGMRGAITGYTMTVESIAGKWKMNQNRKPAERENAKRALAESGRPDQLAVRNEIPD